MARNVSPATIPREISSRSLKLGTPGARLRCAGAIPPEAGRTRYRFVVRWPSALAMPRTVSPALYRRQGSSRSQPHHFSVGGKWVTHPSRLAWIVTFKLCALGMRRFQKSPSLGYFPACNSPDHNSAKLTFLLRSRVGSSPLVAHHYLVVFGDHVLNLHVDIRKPLIRSPDILLGTGRTGRGAWGNIRAVIDEVWGQINIRDIQVFLVYKFFEMIGDELLHFGQSHFCFWVRSLFRQHSFKLLSCVHAACSRKASTFSAKYWSIEIAGLTSSFSVRPSTSSPFPCV